MGIFTKKSESRTATVVVAPKTFNDRLTDVKSMFKKAYEEANNLRDEMLGEIAVKQTQIENIQASINEIEATKADTEKFINNLEKFI
jgi:hypothetical protein